MRFYTSTTNFLSTTPQNPKSFVCPMLIYLRVLLYLVYNNRERYGVERLRR